MLQKRPRFDSSCYATKSIKSSPRFGLLFPKVPSWMKLSGRMALRDGLRSWLRTATLTPVGRSNRNFWQAASTARPLRKARSDTNCGQTLSSPALRSMTNVRLHRLLQMVTGLSDRTKRHRADFLAHSLTRSAQLDMFPAQSKAGLRQN